MRDGHYDGAQRDYFFQGVVMLEWPRTNGVAGYLGTVLRASLHGS